MYKGQINNYANNDNQGQMNQKLQKFNKEADLMEMNQISYTNQGMSDYDRYNQGIYQYGPSIQNNQFYSNNSQAQYAQNFNQYPSFPAAYQNHQNQK